jgi:probable HAF family extracellular repeat protein
MENSRKSAIAALVIAFGFGAGNSSANATAVVALGAGEPQQEITVSVAGGGVGSVALWSYGIGTLDECSSCIVRVARGVNVLVRPIPASGSRFMGFSGRCTGPYQCSFDVDEDVSIEARFEPASAVEPPRFDLMFVSNLGGLMTYPNALDDEGRLAGRYQSGAEYGIFLWTGQMQTFPDPEGFYALVSATSGGRVAGTLVPRESPYDRYRAYVAAEGLLFELGTLGGNWSLARAVSSSGTIVGESFTADGDVHAFSWTNGAMSDLGTLPGKPSSIAYAIDEDGGVIGVACDEYRRGYPVGCNLVAFRGGAPMDLGPLPQTMGVNVVGIGGHVAGGDECSRPDGGGCAFFWHEGETLDATALSASYAWFGRYAGVFTYGIGVAAINSAGDAVGNISTPIGDGSPSLAILLRDGELFGLMGRWSIAINARGQILTADERRVMLLTPRRDQ